MLSLAPSRQSIHNSKSYDEIKFRVAKGKRAVLQEHAQKLGKSVNSYLIELAENDMKPTMGADFSLTSKDATEE